MREVLAHVVVAEFDALSGVESALDIKNQMLVKMYNRKAIDPDQIVEYFLSYRDRLAPTKDKVVDLATTLNAEGMSEAYLDCEVL